MTKHNKARFAGTAIAAVLALGTTPAMAQDAAAPAASPPPIVLPPVASTPPASEPVTTTAAPTVPEPAPLTVPAIVPEPEPVASASAPAQRSPATVRARTTSAPRVAAAAPRAEPVAAAPVASPEPITPLAAAPDPVSDAVVAPPATAETPAPVVASDDGMGDELLLGGGLLAALGLAGVGFAATRRRRRRPITDDEDTAYLEPTPVEPIAVEPAPVFAPQPLAGAMAKPSVTYAQAVPARPATAPTWTSAASFALPATLPTDPNERRELLKRMVAATPDDANPFKTRKARMRRARIILATREAQASRAPAERIAPRAASIVRQREFEDA